jgi:diguanylate cyclase (GGDEF)-like protein/PAS domain S-box-containing protein
MPQAKRSHVAHEATLQAQAREWAQLRQELDHVRSRLADAEETLRAIRNGEVDALVIGAEPGLEQIFTLASVDRPYRNFVENMTDGAATVSADGIVLFANQALAVLLGSSCQRIVGQPANSFLAAGASLHTVESGSGQGGSVEAALLTTEGATVPVLVGSSSLTLDGAHVTCLTFTDLTNERRAEAAVAHSAQHDALTGLPNRAVLTDRTMHALARRESATDLTALLFCDIDGFKNINDSYGHQMGDQVLRAVASRLMAALRPADTVARIGGDEFIVLCEGLESADDAVMLAARARNAVSAPFSTEAAAIDVTVSIGVAITDGKDGATPDSLFRDADEAMYKAKREGPNVVELFDAALRGAAASRLALLSELRHAETKGELRLVYQPIMAMANEEMVGVEALLRWQHPSRGLVAPDEFVPFAERSGMIIDIGAWVLREGCQQLAAWNAHMPGTRSLQMSVNVSARQLARAAGFVHSVKRSIEASGIHPAMLGLEVTESALMEDAESARRVLNELKELGVRIAIDDFGTGYSSLIYLKKFPVDALKIDKSFVAGLGENQDDTAIVRSVVDLARSFAIETVAEGIETRAQLAVLQSFGCNFGQGYLWSPGRPAGDLGPMLSRSFLDTTGDSLPAL